MPRLLCLRYYYCSGHYCALEREGGGKARCMLVSLRVLEPAPKVKTAYPMPRPRNTAVLGLVT